MTPVKAIRVGVGIIKRDEGSCNSSGKLLYLRKTKTIEIVHEVQ